MTEVGDITGLLVRWQRGDRAAMNELTPLVYAHLHKLAESAFRGERDQHTLQPTAIINEAYLNLVDASVEWQNRGHFFALAARMMRRILVNHANARGASKRGGGQVLLTYQESRMRAGAGPADDVLFLDQALNQLAKLDERKAEIVELHYFGGMTYEQVAESLDLSPATVKRDLRFARAWIRKFLTGNG